MRRVLLLIACLETVALAGPQAGDTDGHDPDGAPRASSPWIDLAPSHVLETHALDIEHPEDHRLRSALELGSFYTGFSVWAYFAWYRHHPP